jgi:hypothetical protein
MSEHIELRWPVTPLSATLREGELAPPPIISAVEHLEAINAKLLAALEAWIEHVDRFHHEHSYPGNRCDWCLSREAEAREAIREAKEEA